MRKLFLSIIALTLGIGAWAQETQSVKYIDADGQQQTVTATEITSTSSTLAVGWYVVLGSDVQTGTLTCNGAVHLILADGAKLTATGNDQSATPGITVSGNGNSLAIYGQTAQSGCLIAKGGQSAAGIGGGNKTNGSNITINGGMVIANGGEQGGDGIGGGLNGSSSNIKVGTALAIYADNNNPPTTDILHVSGYDIAPYLNGKRYALVKDVTTSIKESAIADIDAAIYESDNDHIIAIATNAKTAINVAVSIEVISALKTQALAAIASAKMACNSILGELGTPQTGCAAVEVTKGDKTVTLYAPEKVKIIKKPAID